MALISKKFVTDRETASYKLDRKTIELVRTYSEFIGSPQEHVVNEALIYLFRKDKEFNAWLRANNRDDLLATRPIDGADNDKSKVRVKSGTLPAGATK